MNPILLVLALYLEEFGISWHDKGQRRIVQCMIYLTQYFTGLDLGYRFGWYNCGPWSRCLHEDYYGLLEYAEIFGNEDLKAKQLRSNIKSAFDEFKKKIDRILTVPEGIGLDLNHWVNLVTSLHYLEAICDRDREEALKVLSELQNLPENTSILHKYVDIADEILRDLETLPAAQNHKRKRAVAV